MIKKYRKKGPDILWDKEPPKMPLNSFLVEHIGHEAYPCSFFAQWDFLRENQILIRKCLSVEDCSRVRNGFVSTSPFRSPFPEFWNSLRLQSVCTMEPISFNLHKCLSLMYSDSKDMVWFCFVFSPTLMVPGIFLMNLLPICNGQMSVICFLLIESMMFYYQASCVTYIFWKYKV